MIATRDSRLVWRVVGTLFALLSSALWGTSDFLGGTASRRLPLVGVVASSEVFGLIGLLTAAAVTSSFGSPTGYLKWAVLGAVASTGGILAFYEALSTGTMGVVAPIAALGVVVPVVFGIGQGDRPNALQGAGVVVAILGVVLASGPELRPTDETSRRMAARPLLLAVVAAVGFGFVFVAIDHGARYSTVMTLIAMRSTCLLLLMVIAAITGWKNLKVGLRDLPMLAAIGGFDVSANAAFGYASRHGLLSLVSVLSSLYPAITVVLARSVHSERLTRVQLAGVCGALAGVALIASAGAT
jgi:drug/metabolite transporter (DMT)-like permease